MRPITSRAMTRGASEPDAVTAPQRDRAAAEGREPPRMDHVAPAAAGASREFLHSRRSQVMT